MSTWLELSNEIKRRHSTAYLTDPQRLAHEALLQHLRGPNWVNLCGPPGSGKTLLAWLITRATGLTYVAHPARLRHLPPAPIGLIIDNAPVSEADARTILAECGLLNCLTVLLVTQRQIELQMRRVVLPLPTSDDIQVAARTLARLGYACNRASLPPQPSYWDVLAACI